MILLKPLFFLWRAWLWVSVLFGLIAFSPIGVIFISFEKTYHLFHLFCRWWCRLVLILNGFWYDLKLGDVVLAYFISSFLRKNEEKHGKKFKKSLFLK